jgi:hypothetical protein
MYPPFFKQILENQLLCPHRFILKRNADALGTNTRFNFTVHAGIFSAPLHMPIPLDNPTLQVSPNNLRVTGNNVEGCFGLGSVELRYEI